MELFVSDVDTTPSSTAVNGQVALTGRLFAALDGIRIDDPGPRLHQQGRRIRFLSPADGSAVCVHRFAESARPGGCGPSDHDL